MWGAHVAAAQAATYVFSAPDYTNFTAFTAPCGFGSCANFTPSMRVQGSFATAAPIPASRPFTDISASITSFDFSDGLVTYSSTDPQVRLTRFTLQTDATGAITGIDLWLQRWRTNVPVHAANSLFDSTTVRLGAASGVHNSPCVIVDALSADNGRADVCHNTFAAPYYSEAYAVTGNMPLLAPPPAATAVPALDGWGLALLGLAVAAAGAAVQRRSGAPQAAGDAARPSHPAALLQVS